MGQRSGERDIGFVKLHLENRKLDEMTNIPKGIKYPCVALLSECKDIQMPLIFRLSFHLLAKVT